MKLSLISPSRDNLKYLKWSYESVRKHCDPSVEYCVADDFSNDHTITWCQEISKTDSNFKFIRNDGPTRLGHTILYDQLIEEVATGDVIMIWHADMYATPEMDKRILREIDKKRIISLTRIEPSLHPPGPEKITHDFGIEPEEFDEKGFLEFELGQRQTKQTQGMFAPWAIMKDDFLAINGHDPLYAPQSREDSDIFNRFLLAGYEPIQLWDTFVYHMTCRGSRFNPTLTTPGIMSQEWKLQNIRSERNFTRKWGHFIKVDNNLKPIVPHKYKIGFNALNCNYGWIYQLEPWCHRIFISNDLSKEIIKQYIIDEQPNTLYDLSKRVLPVSSLDEEFFDVLVEFDCQKIQQSDGRFISELSNIITQTGEIGSYTHGIFKIQIFSLNIYEDTLIIVDKNGALRD